MTGSVPPFLTIAQAGRLIAAKRLSPVELVKKLLARIETIDSRLHAFLLVTERQALTAARAAERAVMAGHKGPLLGIPLGYKDIYETPVCGRQRIPGFWRTTSRPRTPRRCAGCMPRARS